jgi:aminoglycoside phosphotransferase (APT) family kinase protein
LKADDAQTLRDAAALTGRWAASPAQTFSLIHGDYRLDNLMFDPNGSAVTALDWQTATSGPPARDLAYFLGTSLVSDQRREHEKDLVGAYCAALGERGVDYPLGQAWLDYRAGMLQGPLITVLGRIYATAAPSADADEMFLVMARRSCAAIRDLNSLASIDG